MSYPKFAQLLVNCLANDPRFECAFVDIEYSAPGAIDYDPCTATAAITDGQVFSIRGMLTNKLLRRLDAGTVSTNTLTQVIISNADVERASVKADGHMTINGVRYMVKGIMAEVGNVYHNVELRVASNG